MTATQKPPTCETLTCPCVRGGKPATKQTTVVYQDDGTGLPRLHIYTDRTPTKGGWRTVARFKVEEIPTGMSGRAFILHRSADAIAADPDHEERYAVLIGFQGQGDLCECKGYLARGYCKHTAAMRWAVEAGHIDRPHADVPPEPFPSAEQVAAESGLNMPF